MNTPPKEFFEFLEATDKLDFYEAALETSLDFAGDQEHRLRACDDIDKLKEEFEKQEILHWYYTGLYHGVSNKIRSCNEKYAKSYQLGLDHSKLNPDNLRNLGFKTNIDIINYFNDANRNFIG